MYNKIPGNADYSITLSGELKNNHCEECTLPLVNNKVFISIYGKEYWLDINWLALFSHFETELQEEFRERFLDINFQDDRKWSKNSSGKIMTFRKPLLIDRKYRVVPGFTRYAVTYNGEVLDLKNWKVTKIIKRVEKGYPSITGYNSDRKIYHSLYIHRLVALAWVPNKCYFEKPVVNHMDGDKNNYHYKNLEWVTFSENSEHAVLSGLRLDTIRCKTRNALTGEIKEFESVRKACEFIGISSTTKIQTLIYKTKNRLISGTFELKTIDDQSPWFYEKHKLGTIAGRYTLILTYKDGIIEEHPDVRTFQKKFKIWNVSGIKGLIDRFKKMFPDILISVLDNYKNGQIECYNISNGKIIEADGIRQMSDIINIDFSTIHNCLKRGETRMTKGFAFRYKSDKPWNMNFTKYKSSSWCIMATNRKTNETKIFSSLREASKFFKRDRSFIKLCLQKQWHYGEWKLSEVNTNS